MMAIMTVTTRGPWRSRRDSYDEKDEEESVGRRWTNLDNALPCISIAV
jgi:hypothetical protein